MSTFRQLLILFMLGGLCSGLASYGFRDVIIQQNSIYLLPSLIIMAFTALIVPRYLSYRICLISLSLLGILCLATPYPLISSIVTTKIFPILLMILLWGLASHIYSFGAACWHFPFLGAGFGLGATLATFFWLFVSVKDFHASIIIGISFAAYSAATAWVTRNMKPAFDLPIPKNIDPRCAAWKEYILPSTLMVGGSIFIAQLLQFTFNTEHSDEPIRTHNLAVYVALAHLAAVILMTALAFYLRRRKIEAWKTCAYGSVFLGMWMMVWPLFAFISLWPFAYDIDPLQPALIYYQGIMVVIISLASRIALTALPQTQRFTALIWLEVLVSAILFGSMSFARFSGDLLVVTILPGWLLTLLGILLLETTVKTHHKDSPV